jgi:hypothetical protein
MRYAIFWQNQTIKDTEHHGDYCLDQKTAKKECDRLNREYPNIKHWFER